MSWSPSSDVEAEAGVCGQAFGVHPVKDRDPPVDVVVELDAVLSFVGAEETKDVLHHSSLKREWEGQEQRVELWPVESFAEVGASGDMRVVGDSKRRSHRAEAAGRAPCSRYLPCR